MLEDTQTYVPAVVRNILTVWYVYMQLSNPIPTFAGLVIGLGHGVLAQSTPALIGYDLFYPPDWLTFMCEKLLNPKTAVEVDQRRRLSDQEYEEEMQAQAERDAMPTDASTER